mmetsp:Transcript_15976/g.36862  ORF Transcript_15976/g.36862 Transcript_15976/m.36862 type:complete len:304 (-) Transcript_15976:15-926(-)
MPPMPPMPGGIIPPPAPASIIFIMSSGSIDFMIPAAAIMACAQASLSSSISDIPGMEAIMAFIMGLLRIICRDSSSFSGSFMYSEKSGELVSSFIIFMDSAMSGMPPPAPPMPPDMSLDIMSSSPPAPPPAPPRAPSSPFIMSARLSPPPLPLLLSAGAGELAAAAVDEAFFLLPDDFLAGTQFSWSPSTTPASDKLSLPFASPTEPPPPRRLPLCKIFPCFEGGIPLCSSNRSCSSETVVTSSIWYFFPLRVTWTFETGVGAAAEASPRSVAPTHNFKPERIFMVIVSLLHKRTSMNTWYQL